MPATRTTPPPHARTARAHGSTRRAFCGCARCCRLTPRAFAPPPYFAVHTGYGLRALRARQRGLAYIRRLRVRAHAYTTGFAPFRRFLCGCLYRFWRILDAAAVRLLVARVLPRAFVFCSLRASIPILYLTLANLYLYRNACRLRMRALAVPYCHLLPWTPVVARHLSALGFACRTPAATHTCVRFCRIPLPPAPFRCSACGWFCGTFTVRGPSWDAYTRTTHAHWLRLTLVYRAG